MFSNFYIIKFSCVSSYRALNVERYPLVYALNGK